MSRCFCLPLVVLQNKWLGQSVDVNDKLELTGEIEKNLTTTELDVNIVNSKMLGIMNI